MWDRVNLRIKYALQICRNYSYFDYDKAAEKKQLLSYLPKVGPSTCKTEILKKKVFGWTGIKFFNFSVAEYFVGESSVIHKKNENPLKSNHLDVAKWFCQKTNNKPGVTPLFYYYYTHGLSLNAYFKTGTQLMTNIALSMYNLNHIILRQNKVSSSLKFSQ